MKSIPVWEWDVNARRLRTPSVAARWRHASFAACVFRLYIRHAALEAASAFSSTPGLYILQNPNEIDPTISTFIGWIDRLKSNRSTDSGSGFRDRGPELKGKQTQDALAMLYAILCIPIQSQQNRIQKSHLHLQRQFQRHLDLELASGKVRTALAHHLSPGLGEDIIPAPPLGLEKV